MLRSRLGAYAALLCGTALTGPALAQTDATRRLQQQIESQEQQMQTQQQRIQSLEDRLNAVTGTVQQQQNDISIVRSAQQQAPAAAGDGWKVGLFKGRPSIYSADGENSLSLVGRLQFDVGKYFQNSEPGVGGATGADQRTQKDLNSGYNLRRARLGVTGTYARDWQFDFVEEFGNVNTAGVTQAGAGAANPVPGSTAITGQILTASLTYTGFKNVALVAGYTDVYDAFGEAVSSADISFNERAAITNLVTNFAGNEPRAAFGVLGSGDRWYSEGWVTGPQNTVPTNGQQAAVAARGGFLPYKAADSFFAIGGNGSYVFVPPHNDVAAGTSSNGISPPRQNELHLFRASGASHRSDQLDHHRRHQRLACRDLRRRICGRLAKLVVRWRSRRHHGRASQGQPGADDTRAKPQFLRLLWRSRLFPHGRAAALQHRERGLDDGAAGKSLLAVRQRLGGVRDRRAVQLCQSELGLALQRRRLWREAIDLPSRPQLVSRDQRPLPA
jgi:hypothetical protein